ncbi:uncharacterized protein STEHIDRAFT_122254 [Stereum hirsutum FP-91666 SS1]|uniref:uncharacterized protein n=1 Tax=Stereum hirsutum (strain FP-91666) TaxID=721885 RepID=UPI000444A2FA|nr:uncharacterized protein STEHIDRAFT_122254 [Stereum hirsutum FP-91666 SS1]EIM85247.1 hypothetical protein STEHIDRAFT_122254 [Stereum hirsutum FP-91666 SS1]
MNVWQAQSNPSKLPGPIDSNWNKSLNRIWETKECTGAIINGAPDTYVKQGRLCENRFLSLREARASASIAFWPFSNRTMKYNAV